MAQKEFTFKEIAEMRKKFGVVSNGDTEDFDENSIGSDENVWDIQVNDADQAFKDLLGVCVFIWLVFVRSFEPFYMITFNFFCFENPYVYSNARSLCM